MNYSPWMGRCRDRDRRRPWSQIWIGLERHPCWKRPSRTTSDNNRKRGAANLRSGFHHQSFSRRSPFRQSRSVGM